MRYPAADAFESCFAAMGCALKRDAQECDILITQRRRRNRDSGFSAIEDDDDEDNEEAFKKSVTSREEALNRARAQASAAVTKLFKLF